MGRPRDTRPFPGSRGSGRRAPAAARTGRGRAPRRASPRRGCRTRSGPAILPSRRPPRLRHPRVRCRARRRGRRCRAGPAARPCCQTRLSRLRRQSRHRARTRHLRRDRRGRSRPRRPARNRRCTPAAATSSPPGRPPGGRQSRRSRRARWTCLRGSGPWVGRAIRSADGPGSTSGTPRDPPLAGTDRASGVTITSTAPARDRNDQARSCFTTTRGHDPWAAAAPQHPAGAPGSRQVTTSAAIAECTRHESAVRKERHDMSSKHEDAREVVARPRGVW